MEDLTIHARMLRTEDSFFLYHLLLRRVTEHPLNYFAHRLPYEQVANLMQVFVRCYEVRFAKQKDGFRRFNLVYDRELLYQRLLQSGAPAALLHRYFAKGRRQIARDRRALGGRPCRRGRPRVIDSDLSYEISGRWDILRLEEVDFARRFEALSGFYPDVPQSTLYTLLSELGLDS